MAIGSKPRPGARQRGWILASGIGATLFGALVVILSPLFSNPTVITASAPFQLILFMLAAIAVSSIVGVIFGVPRARTVVAQIKGDEATLAVDGSTYSRYEANSNLEQISDWLTKILVGAGLVQLAALPGFLRRIGDYLGATIGTAGPQIAVATVLYGVGVGFLFAYLWARLRLRVLLETSEADARGESVRNLIVRGLVSASVNSEHPDSADDIQRVAERADKLKQAFVGFGSVLWVDDHPENNTELIRTMREFGVDIRLADSTREALNLLERRKFGLIVTDLGREEEGEDDRFAGLELIKRVSQIPDHPPIFVYAGSRGVEHAHLLTEAGAAFVTSSPTALFDQAIQVLAGSAPSSRRSWSAV